MDDTRRSTRPSPAIMKQNCMYRFCTYRPFLFRRIRKKEMIIHFYGYYDRSFFPSRDLIISINSRDGENAKGRTR